jgi:hypothetical protein
MGVQPSRASKAATGEAAKTITIIDAQRRATGAAKFPMRPMTPLAWRAEAGNSHAQARGAATGDIAAIRMFFQK